VSVNGSFCPNCGTRNDADATFCESCGQPLGGYAPPPPSHAAGTASSYSSAAPLPAGKSSRKALLPFLIVGVALFAAYRFLPWQQWVLRGMGASMDTTAAVDSAMAADSAFGIVEPHIMGNPNGPGAPPLGPYDPNTWPGGDSTSQIRVIGGDSVLTGAGGDIDMYFQLALAMEQQGSWSFAEGVYRQILDVDANNANAHAGLAGALLRQGKRDQALAEAQRAKQLGHPGNTSVFKELGIGGR
jgi:hypothetical protein